MTELDAGGVASVLTTNSELDFLICLAPFFDCDLHQTADTFGVKLLKRIFLVDPFFDVGVQKLSRIVTREAVGHLREIVGAEGKKLRRLRDLVRLHAGSWKLDH